MRFLHDRDVYSWLNSFTDTLNLLVLLGFRVQAPVAQWIEHRPPEAGAQVQLLSGARK